MFVHLQLEMHGKTCPMLGKLKDKMNRKISQTLLEAATRRDLHTRLEGMPKHRKLCHGVFTPPNIIIAEHGAPCILDGSHATQGNASADQPARTCCSGSAAIMKVRRRFWISSARQYVQKWRPVVAAGQSVKGNESEREFLLSWVNVVDYQ